jgi:hypothetical protein
MVHVWFIHSGGCARLNTVIVLRFNTDQPSLEYHGSVDEIILKILEARIAALDESPSCIML